MAARPDQKLLRVVAAVAPGTPFREGLDRILQAQLGALVVVGDGPDVLAICSGGFLLDAEFSPQRLSELAKMDGALVLAPDASRIARANVHLLPNPSVPTSETGTRHRTAERVARSVSVPVVAISEEMSVISVYRGEHRHRLEPIGHLLDRASQALSTLSGYRSRLDALTTELSRHEIDDLVNVRDVVFVLQRCELMRRMGDEIGGTVIELGSEGRLVQLQLDELLAGMERMATLVLRDYLPARMWEDGGHGHLAHLSTDDLFDETLVARAFGLGETRHERGHPNLNAQIEPRGYRVLARIPRMADTLIENVADHFGSLSALLGATVHELTEVEGVGDVRARAIREGLQRVVTSVSARQR